MICLERGPELREFFDAQCLRADLDEFDLISEIGGSKGLEGRWQDASAHLLRWNCRERRAYSLSREQRRLMQKLHRISHEDFGLILFATISHQQVVQVDRERRIRHSIAIAVSRRKPRISPALVWSQVIEVDIQAGLLLHA